MPELQIHPYAIVAVLTALALIFPFVPLGLARWLAPRKPGQEKQATYECGLESEGEAWVQFKVQYFLYALAFVIFDVEVVFLVPWAVAYFGLGWDALIKMALFVGLLAGGLAWAWVRGALQWR
jgi:NADH-quinone oxidoreductase subunit A